MADAVEISIEQRSIDTWIGASLVVFAFLVPIETLLPIKLFRASEGMVIAAWLYTLVRLRPFPSPISLRVAAGTAIASVVVSLLFAADRRTALDTGILEVAALFALIHIYAAWGTKETLVRFMGAFVFGTVILSAYQIVSLYPAFPNGAPPFSAAAFMAVKDNVGVVQHALTIGNSDNFATLWALAFPLSVGLAAISRPAWPFILSSAIIGYAGLLLYSRASLLVCSLALFAYVIAFMVRGRFRYWRVVVPGVAIAAILAIILSPAAFSTIREGISSYSAVVSSGTASPPATAADPSGAERAEALRRGLTVATHHPLTGIGFGMYPRTDPVLTSPHSQLLLWFSEGGIFGLVSILALCVFVGKALVQSLFGKVAAPGVVASIAAGSMLLKAIVFGGNFSVSSNIVWGLGMAIIITTICRYQERSSPQ